MKNITTLIFILGIASIVYSQNSYFVLNDSDTTYCSDITYSTKSNGYLKDFSYKDKDNKKIELSKDELMAVKTFIYKGIIIDRVPLEASKPDSYVRYLKRTIDGPIKTWIKNPSFGSTSTTSTVSNGTTSASSTVSSSSQYGKYHFNIQLPDGMYVDISNKKDFEEYLLPLLRKCKAIDNMLADFNMPKKISFYDKDVELQLLNIIQSYNDNCQ